MPNGGSACAIMSGNCYTELKPASDLCSSNNEIVAVTFRGQNDPACWTHVDTFVLKFMLYHKRYHYLVDQIAITVIVARLYGKSKTAMIYIRCNQSIFGVFGTKKINEVLDHLHLLVDCFVSYILKTQSSIQIVTIK